MTTGKRQTLADYLSYSICHGQNEMGPIGYSPLPINLVQVRFDQIKKLSVADTRRPARGIRGILLGLAKCGLFLLAHDLFLAAAGAVAGEGIQQAAEAVAGADAEQHQTTAHQDREAEIDALDGAATAATTEIEKHVVLGRSRPSPNGSPNSAAARAAARRSAIFNIDDTGEI